MIETSCGKIIYDNLGLVQIQTGLDFGNRGYLLKFDRTIS